MKTYTWLALALVAVLAAFGCDSNDGGGSDGSSSGGDASSSGGDASSSGGGSSSLTDEEKALGCNTGGTTSGDTCQEQQDYADCTESACTSERDACLGTFGGGSFSGGTCSDWLNCNLDCDCDTACLQGCLTQQTADCTSCLTSMDTCITNECGAPPVCAGDVPGGGGGANCDALAACCEGADATIKLQCDSVVNAGQDSTCETTLAGYKAGGFCE